YTYSPYGTVNAQGPAAGKNHFRWIGTYQLHGGLNLTGHRYYNPTWGRFTQPDPTGQETNPYTYSNCDPINRSDPTGAYGLGDFVGTVADYVEVGAAVGAAAGCVVGAVSSAGPGCVPGAGIGAVGGSLFGLGFGIGRGLINLSGG
ncbi:RHS repeat-associated core domain-containing protein, partial [Amycolatopsis arida]|uniref:RHS repeat-associated core domain-containing protein n=1 Tax=Amycolatopsis arida TaxID=587909 RepID=UPI001066A410